MRHAWHAGPTSVLNPAASWCRTPRGSWRTGHRAPSCRARRGRAATAARLPPAPALQARMPGEVHARTSVPMLPEKPTPAAGCTTARGRPGGRPRGARSQGESSGSFLRTRRTVRGVGGRVAHRFLHLGGESRELLCTRFELLAELRAKLGLLLQQISNRLRTDGRALAQDRLSLRQSRLEDVAGDSVVKAGKALERLEAILLGSGDGGERVLVGLQPRVEVLSTVGHVSSCGGKQLGVRDSILRAFVCNATSIYLYTQSALILLIIKFLLHGLDHVK